MPFLVQPLIRQKSRWNQLHEKQVSLNYTLINIHIQLSIIKNANYNGLPHPQRVTVMFLYPLFIDFLFLTM